jgi:hypothetical protein
VTQYEPVYYSFVLQQEDWVPDLSKPGNASMPS